MGPWLTSVVILDPHQNCDLVSHLQRLPFLVRLVSPLPAREALEKVTKSPRLESLVIYTRRFCCRHDDNPDTRYIELL